MKFIITAKHKSTNEETIIANCFNEEWANLISMALNFTLENIYEFSYKEV